jgi:dTDP-4-dehydrorhamnose 3,5-epimerase-like enzyme
MQSCLPVILKTMNIFDPSSYNALHVSKTDIPGLLVIALAIHGDSRGWFKESFQKEKMVEQGFPADFQVVQNNVFYSAQRGATRGIHADAWDKYVSIAIGSAFAAVADLRAGDHFGKVLTFELNPGIALFVPRGCGEAYQSMEDGTTFSTLSNATQTSEDKRFAVALDDPDLKIQWPMPLEMSEVSAKDKVNPMLKDVQPISY